LKKWKESGDTRKKILLAGIKIFARKGYRDATVREICKQAGSANINSIGYYFGSKELLYREILELIFAEYDRRKAPDVPGMTPEQKLKAFILSFCTMLYQEDVFGSDLSAIFVSEMTRPSPFMAEMVDKYNRPRVARHLGIIREILGKGAADEDVRDCLISISGQLLYYSFAWPVFSRLFPDYSTAAAHEKWAEHVYTFSMGGIDACKKKISGRKGILHG